MVILCGREVQFIPDYPQKMCSIWDDVRTYLILDIDPKEKAFLMATFAHFKKKEEVHS